MAHAWVAFLLAPARPGVFEPKKTSGGAGTHSRDSVVFTFTGTTTHREAFDVALALTRIAASV